MNHEDFMNMRVSHLESEVAFWKAEAAQNARIMEQWLSKIEEQEAEIAALREACNDQADAMFEMLSSMGKPEHMSEIQFPLFYASNNN